ncbi:MAG: hypothetical protein AB7H77_08985 [Bdellovibrionales bacterium]
MKGNKLSLLLAGAAFLAAFPVHAESVGGAAPAMFAVEEVLLQFTRFGNNKVAESCGLTQNDLDAVIAKTLKDAGVPHAMVGDAKPAMAGRARINFGATIITLNSQGMDCTSWVSLAAETKNSLHVPPVDISRNVTVVYWREGSLMTTSQTVHARQVSDALQKITRHFAEQYKLDQPPALPGADKEEE